MVDPSQIIEFPKGKGKSVIMPGNKKVNLGN